MAIVRASDIMTSRVVITSQDQTISQASKLMNKYRIGGLPVVKDGKLVGILTERLIMREVIEKNRRPGRVRVKQIMIPENKLVKGVPSDSITALAKKMKTADVSRIPIVENDRLVGIVTNKDIIEHGPSLIDVILEQARLKGPLDPEGGSVAFGKCEKCGDSGDLRFNIDSFLCEDCAGNHQIERKSNFLKAFFRV